MCQKMVVILRITATRAIFEPRRFLILRYQARIFGSCFRKCRTNCPKINRAILLPSLVMEPNRSCRIAGVATSWSQPEVVRQAPRTRETFDRTDTTRQRQAAIVADSRRGHQDLCRVENLRLALGDLLVRRFSHPPEQSVRPRSSIPSTAYPFPADRFPAVRVFSSHRRPA